MQLIKLDATESTNTYLKELLRFNDPEDYTVVTARRQLRGRGQRGAIWQSDAGKNLTFSVLRSGLNLPADDGFLLNVCVSVAIFEVMRELGVPEPAVKWPNDILSGQSKLCGILIENSLFGNRIHASVIGIGLNVNQTEFEHLPEASSLKLLLKRTFHLDGLLERMIMELKSVFAQLDGMDRASLWDAYEKVLFRKGMPSTFEKADGTLFRGRITGVSENGRLIIDRDNDVVETFGFKEVRLKY